MKKFVLFLMLAISSSFTQAQGKYEAGMKKAIADFQAAKTAEDMTKVSAFFERIANAEKDKWLPFYYASLTNNMIGWMDEKTDKDKNAVRSLELLEKAEALEANNSDLFCLRHMIATQQMTVDPMSRWASYGAEATKALDNAKKADPNNPRIYLLEAQSKMNTPEAFGGGKKVAKPIFEKAVELFKTFQPASEFHPSWGADQAASLLADCSK